MTNIVWANALSGAIFMANLVIALFFLRFWKKTNDRLFFIFSLAFFALMIERILLITVDVSNEFRPFVYLVRLVAFLLILTAIIDKNRN